MAFFLVYYLTLNFSVNMFDLCWNHLFKGISYSHDEDFVSSFSYKSHSLVLVSMLAFISAQYTRPAFELFKEVPNSLALLHTFSILVSFSLVVNFLFELTSMAPQTRFKVFRVELVKVFMTVVIFYFLSLWFTTWARSMAQSVQ